ncbi:unnamed protein product [Anisakis simplex]|uniref:Gelsolin-like protein 1 (inferred by orthology to a C. elegans protein) n=1 Tax=Anisakis simplex TaxID=6269 RepID=A0A0M3KBB5_ANISI|nr:unnamed protein product [Anisakis simplex]
MKTVEVDDALEGHPVQYREVQNHESALFLSYFKNGIKYLQGGAASGFNHVDENEFDNWTPRLFQCKGKRNVRCAQVACERASLNLGDVFILDCGADIYVWMPPDSGRLERIKVLKCSFHISMQLQNNSLLKGMRQAQSIRDQERCGTPNLHCLDEDWDTNEEFWSIMGGCEQLGDLKSPQDGGDDSDFWRVNKKPLVLTR